MSGKLILVVPSRRRLRHARGQGAVEFAVLAPIAFLLLLGIVVVSIVVLHQTQLANASRDIARVAAICGSDVPPLYGGTTNTTNLPNGQCSDNALLAYARAQLANIDSTVTWNPTITVTNASGVACTVAGACTVTGSGLASCDATQGYVVHVTVTYPQSLYVPIVSNLFSNAPGGIRTLTATGVATCEQ
jgi:Flp pilus assembly protein TadG